MLFIQEYIKQRVLELTQNENLILHFKHIVLQPNEHIELHIGTAIYLITDLIDDVRVESDTGLFDIGSTETNQQIYEHRGQLIIDNLSSNTNHIPFIQFIEKNIHNGISNSNKHPKNREIQS